MKFLRIKCELTVVFSPIIFFLFDNTYKCIISFFRQAPDQDFSNLPDPFGSYRSELGYKDFGLGQRDDQGLDYIEDPDHLSLMQREISR